MKDTCHVTASIEMLAARFYLVLLHPYPHVSLWVGDIGSAYAYISPNSELPASECSFSRVMPATQ